MKANTQYKSTKPSNKQTSKNLLNILIVFIPVILFIGILLLYFLFRTSSVTGKVFAFNDDKTPLTDVKIILDDNKNFQSNTDSTYQITGLSSGKHKLTFEKEGYQPLNENINLENGQLLDFNAYLTQIPEENNLLKYDFIGLGTDSKTLTSSTANITYDNTNIKANILLLGKSKIYSSDNQNSFISVLDYNNGTQINTVPLPSGLRADKLVISNLKDKIVTVLSNNSIGVIDINNNSFLQASEVLTSKINNLFINKVDNTVYALYDNGLALLSILANYINYIPIDNLYASSSALIKNNLFLSNPRYQEIVKLDTSSLSRNQQRIKLSFTPEKIAITKSGKLYVSSGKNLTIINSDTNEILKSNIDTGVNISNIKVSPTDDNLYITNNSTSVYIFDTTRDELSTNKVLLKSPVQDIYFPE